jgi:hypothetical protein
MWWTVQVMETLTMQSSPASHHFLSPVQIFSTPSCSQKPPPPPPIYVLSLVWEMKFHNHTKQKVKLYFCALNVFLNAIIICYCHSQIFELDNIFQFKDNFP